MAGEKCGPSGEEWGGRRMFFGMQGSSENSVFRAIIMPGEIVPVDMFSEETSDDEVTEILNPFAHGDVDDVPLAEK